MRIHFIFLSPFSVHSCSYDLRMKLNRLQTSMHGGFLPCVVVVMVVFGWSI